MPYMEVSFHLACNENFVGNCSYPLIFLLVSPRECFTIQIMQITVSEVGNCFNIVQYKLNSTQVDTTHLSCSPW